MVTTSEGEDGYPDDNTNNIILPLKYQADLLFTRDTDPHRFEIRSGFYSSSGKEPDTAFPTFNLTFNASYRYSFKNKKVLLIDELQRANIPVQNLGIFFVKDIILEADIWSVTKEGNQLVDITDYFIEEKGTNSSCMLPLIKSTALSKPEDLTHLSQLNSSNSVSIPLHCILSLSPSKALKLTFRGRLHLPTLQAVSFRSLELLTVTTIQLEKTNPMFLQEDILVRQTILDLRKEGPSSIPIWIILGSSLGGLLLLCLVILGLWKLGFFKRRRRQEEEEQPVTNGNAEMQL